MTHVQSKLSSGTVLRLVAANKYFLNNQSNREIMLRRYGPDERLIVAHHMRGGHTRTNLLPAKIWITCPSDDSFWS